MFNAEIFMINRAESLGAKISPVEDNFLYEFRDMPATPMHGALYMTAYDAAIAFLIWHALIKDIQNSTPNDEVGGYMAACAAILALPVAPDLDEAMHRGYVQALDDIRRILAQHGITNA